MHASKEKNMDKFSIKNKQKDKDKDKDKNKDSSIEKNTNTNILTKIFTPYKGLPFGIYILFFATVVNNIGNFVGPFLTLFLTNKAGINVWLVGIIVAVNAGAGLLGSLIGGKLIDSIGRKKVFLFCSTISGIGYAVCAFCNQPLLVALLLVLSGFAGGFSQPVFGTITTDLTEGEQRKAAFSLHYMAINIGFSVGPLLAGFLYKNYLMWFFLGDALTTFLSVALVAFFISETKPTKEQLKKAQSKSYESTETGGLLSALLKRPTLLAFSLIIIIYFTVFSQFTFGLSLQSEDVFGANGAAVFGSLMTINAILCSTVTVFVVALTRNIKPALTIAIGGVLYAVGFGMMFFINAYYMFVLSTAIWTIGEILVSTNTSVYLAEHTPISHRGRFNSVFPIIRKLGFIIGPMIGGFCIKLSGIRSLWIVVALMALLGASMMYRLYITNDKVAEKCPCQSS
jgi:MFS family permease